MPRVVNTYVQTADNEAFSRARFRGSTIGKLATNLEGFRQTRSRRTVHSWCWAQVNKDIAGADNFALDTDPGRFVMHVDPETTHLAIQCGFAVGGGFRRDGSSIAYRAKARAWDPLFLSPFEQGIAGDDWIEGGNASCRVAALEDRERAPDEPLAWPWPNTDRVVEQGAVWDYFSGGLSIVLLRGTWEGVERDLTPQVEIEIEKYCVRWGLCRLVRVDAVGLVGG